MYQLGKGFHYNQRIKRRYNLSYLDVFSTVREASGIPSDVVRNRILPIHPPVLVLVVYRQRKKDSFIIPTSIFGLFGVLLLIMRYWEFCIAIPFLLLRITVSKVRLDYDLPSMLEILRLRHNISFVSNPNTVS